MWKCTIFALKYLTFSNHCNLALKLPPPDSVQLRIFKAPGLEKKSSRNERKVDIRRKIDFFFLLSQKIIVRRDKTSLWFSGFCFSSWEWMTDWLSLSPLTALRWLCPKGRPMERPMLLENLKPNCYCGQIEIHFAWILLTNNHHHQFWPSSFLVVQVHKKASLFL